MTSLTIDALDDFAAPFCPWCGGRDTASAWHDRTKCLDALAANPDRAVEAQLRGRPDPLKTVVDSAYTAHEWFDREYHFAVDAHEMPDSLGTEINAIFDGDWTDVSDRQYREAAQLIACRRNTCGGPNRAHDHVA